MKLKALIFAVVASVASAMAFCPQAAAAESVSPFYRSTKAAHTKQMHRVFTFLGKGDYASAWKEQMALAKLMTADFPAYERALYPLYDLSNAMFMARPTQLQGVSIPRNPLAAVQLVRNIYVRGTDIEQANSFLGVSDIELSTDLIKSMVEKSLIEDVKATGTADAYRELLAVLDPSDPEYKNATDKVAILEFEESCSTVAGCHSYLRNYPNSPLIEKAKDKLLKLEFEHAKEANNENTWNKFITDYQFVKSASAQVDEAKKALVRLQESRLCSKSTTLADLDAYASTHRREVSNRVFVAYDNLVNLPTHSYRFMSLKLNFNGYVGNVEETITESTGTVTINRYKFNAQGLLTEAYNGHNRTLTQYTYAYDARHGYYLASKKEKGKSYTYKCTYNASGRLARITCTDGQVINYTYDADGRITERNETTTDGKNRTSTYKSGKIRTEKTGGTLLRFLRYDGSKATQITSEKGKTKYVWDYAYTTPDGSTHWTRAAATLNGKPRMTITRVYR